VRNELGSLYYSFSKDTDIAGTIDLDFVRHFFSIGHYQAALVLRETWRTQATAAHGVLDTFRGETVITCVTADNFTAFHSMRN
jgi:hypothetical protein